MLLFDLAVHSLCALGINKTNCMLSGLIGLTYCAQVSGYAVNRCRLKIKCLL